MNTELLRVPTVGRVVLFRRAGRDLPAVVVRVYNEVCLNLFVMTDEPGHSSGIEFSVLMDQSVSPGLADKSWRWPC